MKTYYVYKLISPSEKIYIGITSRHPKERWRNGWGYQQNAHLKRAIDKYGFDKFQKIILHDGLSKNKACEFEKYYIKLYNSNNPKYGYNNSSGGENPAEGMKHTEETKQRISQSLKGKMAGINNPMYGSDTNNITDEFGHLRSDIRDKIKIKAKERMKDSDFALYMQSFNESKKRKINQYDLDGKFIRQWNSRKEAEQALGICAQTIHKVCKRKVMKNGGKSLTAGGFQWRFSDDCEDIGKCTRKKTKSKPS